MHNEKNLNEEDQRYLDIIERSIDEDIKKEALSHGFSSVEQWREHNAKVFLSTRSVSDWEKILTFLEENDAYLDWVKKYFYMMEFQLQKKWQVILKLLTNNPKLILKCVLIWKIKN